MVPGRLPLWVCPCWSKPERKVQQIIADYLNARTNMMCLFVLIDARLGHRPWIWFIRSAALSQIPFAMIFTKRQAQTRSTHGNIEYYKKPCSRGPSFRRCLSPQPRMGWVRMISEFHRGSKYQVGWLIMNIRNHYIWDLLTQLQQPDKKHFNGGT